MSYFKGFAHCKILDWTFFLPMYPAVLLICKPLDSIFNMQSFFFSDWTGELLSIFRIAMFVFLTFPKPTSSHRREDARPKHTHTVRNWDHIRRNIVLRHASLSLWRLCSQGKNLILSLASIMLTAALHPLRSSLLPALFSLRFNFPSQSSNSNQSKLLQMQCFAFRLNAFPVTSGSVPKSPFYLWPLSVSAVPADCVAARRHVMKTMGGGKKTKNGNTSMTEQTDEHAD